MEEEDKFNQNYLVTVILCTSQHLAYYLGVPSTSDTKSDIVIGVSLFGVLTGVLTGIFISTVVYSIFLKN